MPENKEARRGERGRTSMMSLGGDIAEDTVSTTNLQAIWLTSRYPIGAAHARLLAELHFGGVHSRASR
jgi:hypothetical protein